MTFGGCGSAAGKPAPGIHAMKAAAKRVLRLPFNIRINCLNVFIKKLFQFSGFGGQVIG